LVEITLSLLTPYAAYLAGERLGVSGILAVVAAGLYSGWRDPVRMDAQTRQTAWAVWSMVIFWLNGLAFLLLGLQFPRLWRAVASEYSLLQLIGFVGAIAGLAMILRIAWFFPGAYLPHVFSRRVRANEERPSWQTVFVGGWAGMRGTVTLAAALSIPLALPNGAPFPGRDLVIFLAFGVIAVTLLLQGTTLQAVICRLGLQEDGLRAREDRLARIAAVKAGLRALRELEPGTATPEEAAALGLVISEYEERSSELVAEGETQTRARDRLAAERQYRLAALVAERRALDDLWRRNVIVDEVHRPLQQLLDYEESLLRGRPATAGDPA
jgi:CPA1 family monovalent cation:H+ antiporter